MVIIDINDDVNTMSDIVHIGRTWFSLYQIHSSRLYLLRLPLLSFSPSNISIVLKYKKSTAEKKIDLSLAKFLKLASNGVDWIAVPLAPSMAEVVS